MTTDEWDTFRRVHALDPRPSDGPPSPAAFLFRVGTSALLIAACFGVALGVKLAERGPDVGPAWREVAAHHTREQAKARRTADSLAALAAREYRAAQYHKARYNAARNNIGRVRALPAGALNGHPQPVTGGGGDNGSYLPPVRGGWGWVVSDAGEVVDTLPTPALVIAQLQLRDVALELADSAIVAQRLALGRYSAAIPLYQSALARSDSARVIERAGLTAERNAARRARWTWGAWGALAGVVLTLTLR